MPSPLLVIKPPDRPMTSAEKWAYGVFLILLVALFAAELLRDPQPVKLTVLFFLFFWFVLLAIHEAGHALMAAALGWQVRRVVIGLGPVLTRLTVRGVPVTLRIIPVEGYVSPRPTNLRRPALKNALIYFAGPGAELVVVGLLLLFVGPAQLLSGTDSLVILAAQAAALAALTGVVINLIPHQVETRGGWTANDGLGMIQSFRVGREHYERLMTEEDDEDDDQNAG